MADKTKDKPEAPIIQHPANATHLMMPHELMQELITAAAVKYTWAELDPLMNKVKAQMRAVHVDGDVATMIKQPQNPT